MGRGKVWLRGRRVTGLHIRNRAPRLGLFRVAKIFVHVSKKGSIKENSSFPSVIR